LPGQVLASENDDLEMSIIPADYFSDGTAIRVVSENGFLILDKDDRGQHFNRGIFQSKIIKANGSFDSIFFSHKTLKPENTSATFFVRSIMNEKKSQWYEVDEEGEAILADRADSYQYRVVLSTTDSDSTPEVQGLHFLFDLRSDNYPLPVSELNLPSQNSNGTNAAVTAPAITERQDWGAEEPSDNYSEHIVTDIIVHHTGIPDTSAYEGIATIQGIQHYHMHTKHWLDIGYHFLIGPEGTIYRGRPEGVSGAHCVPNTGKIGISVIGNFEIEKISVEARASLVALLKYLCPANNVPRERIFGHRDFATTDCPGANLYELLPQIVEETSIRK
jgi:hypothetical protein